MNDSIIILKCTAIDMIHSEKRGIITVSTSKTEYSHSPSTPSNRTKVCSSSKKNLMKEITLLVTIT